MFLKTVLLYFLYGFCWGRVQPLPTDTKFSLIDEVKERLSLQKTSVLNSIWDSDMVSSCDVKRPAESNLNDLYFLKFRFDQYLCSILCDISLYHLSETSKVREGFGLKQKSFEDVIRESPTAKNFCQSMKNIKLPPNVDEKERFKHIMKNLSECSEHCIAGDDVNPLCAFVLWVSNSSNIIQQAPMQPAAYKGNLNGAAVSSNVGKQEHVDLPSGTSTGVGVARGPVVAPTVEKDFPSSARGALPGNSRVPAATGVEGVNKPSHVPATTGVEGVNKPVQGTGVAEPQSVNPVSAGSALSGGSAEGTTLLKGPVQHTPVNVATNGLGNPPDSAPVGDMVQTGEEPIPNGEKGIDEDGGQGVEADDGGDRQMTPDEPVGGGQDDDIEGYPEQDALRESPEPQPEPHKQPEDPEPMQPGKPASKAQFTLHRAGESQGQPQPPELKKEKELQGPAPNVHGNSAESLKHPQKPQPVHTNNPKSEQKVHPQDEKSKQAPSQNLDRQEPELTQPGHTQAEEPEPEPEQTQPEVTHLEQTKEQQSAEATPSLIPVAPQNPAKSSEKTQIAIAEEGGSFADPGNIESPPEDDTQDKAKSQKDSTLGQPNPADDDDDFGAVQDDDGGDSLDLDMAEENSAAQRTSQTEVKSSMYSPERFPDAEDSHFFAYFMTMMVLCIVGYLIFHNKQKILALALEGRSRRGTRRRPNTSGYRKLDSNLEEAVTSGCSSTSVTHVIY